MLRDIFYAVFFKQMSKSFNIRADHVLTIAVHVPVYPFSQILQWLADFQFRTTPMIMYPISTQKSSNDLMSDSCLNLLSSVCSPELLTALNLNIQGFRFAASLKRNAFYIALVSTGVRDTASCVSYSNIAPLPFAFWGVRTVLFIDFNSISKCLVSQRPLATMSNIVKLMPHRRRLVLNLSL